MLMDYEQKAEVDPTEVGAAGRAGFHPPGDPSNVLRCPQYPDDANHHRLVPGGRRR